MIEVRVQLSTNFLSFEPRNASSSKLQAYANAETLEASQASHGC